MRLYDASLSIQLRFFLFQGGFICYDTKDDIARDRVLYKLLLQVLPLHVSFQLEIRGNILLLLWRLV